MGSRTCSQPLLKNISHVGKVKKMLPYAQGIAGRRPHRLEMLSSGSQTPALASKAGVHSIPEQLLWLLSHMGGGIGGRRGVMPLLQQHFTAFVQGLSLDVASQPYKRGLLVLTAFPF